MGGCVASSASNGRAWHYGLDALGRTVSQVAPDNQSATDLDTTVWTYEGGGRLGSVTDQTAAGVVGRHTDFTSDKLGRTLTSKVYLGAGTSGNLRQTTTRTYTIDGDPASVAFDGAGDGLGVPLTYSYTYDALGRPDLVKQGSTTMTDLAYSADGTVSQRIDTNPVSTGTTYTTTFGYDWAKRPASVASPSVFTGSATTTYRLDGLLATRTTPNGETLTLAYDAARRPLTATLAAGNMISQTYDRVGNVTTDGRALGGITGDPGSGTNTFSYDPLRRLTAETGLSAARSYQYDLDGNRTRKVEGATTIDYTYDRTDQLINQTIAGLGTAFSYDPYGNLTQAGNGVSAVTTYTFDTASHLATINAPGTAQDVALTLDALGRFASRTVNGGTDTYGYLGASETATTIVGATTRVSALAADGSRVATKDGSTTGYLLPDLHGNVVAAEASASTTISNALRYDGYGQSFATYTGTGPIAMDVKYQGRLDLSATDDPLYDMSARFYAPGTGTFTQLDSVMGSAQNPLSMNRFLYAEANPTSFIDPTGHYVTESDGDQDNPCRYKGDAGCGETANCSTCKLEPPTKPKPKPGDNDSSDNTDDTCPLCNDKDDKDVTAVTWNYEEWQKSIEDQGIPDWARDGDKVDAHGCRIAVKGWCSHPASLTDLVIFTVIVVGGIVVVLVLGPVIVEAGVSTAAVYAATGATGVANMAAPSLTKIGQIILEGEGGATLPRVTLYRGVGSSELADITATGTYRIAGSSAAFGKYFYPTMDQAKAFVDKGWASRVTSATFPQVAVDSAERLNPAGEGPALFILAEYFPYGPVTIH